MLQLDMVDVDGLVEDGKELWIGYLPENKSKNLKSIYEVFVVVSKFLHQLVC